jgi:hypothetical protein
VKVWEERSISERSDERRDSGYDKLEDGDGLWDDVDRTSYISYTYLDTSSLPMWACPPLGDYGAINTNRFLKSTQTVFMFSFSETLKEERNAQNAESTMKAHC